MHQESRKTHMDHAKKSLSSSPTRKWIVLMLMIVIMESVFLGRVKSEDQAPTEGNPAAGLLCISDCATCPVICSPPPPPPRAESKPPPASPPPHHSSPPYSYYYKSPPPPKSQPSPSPPPPPSYISWGSNPPLPPSYNPWGSNPPPPPSYVNVPSGQMAPPKWGNRNSTYPYYYFYASEAASPSLHSSFILIVLVSFLAVMVDWQVGR